ncbi:MAG: Uma2 family endonuclease [Pirellulales bacterium]|nr:Uma2 family endonuclease [Pirellulales bacterium]
MIHLTITSAGAELPAGSEVILRNQTWADYEGLLECRQDNAAIKVRYDARTQEIRIMAPLPRHGKNSLALSNLVQALLRHVGRDWEGFDPITLKRFGEAGVEPDKCFYIQHREAILGKELIDLENDPPPDLAIEVDATSSTSAEDYVPLRVPELWIYREDSLHIYLFDGQHYRESPDSPTFPGIPVRRLIPEYVERAWQAGSSVALRQFETALPDTTSLGENA